jgi:hypothetical protein
MSSTAGCFTSHGSTLGASAFASFFLSADQVSGHAIVNNSAPITTPELFLTASFPPENIAGRQHISFG